MSIIPTTLYDCYDYVIGLSRTECNCLDPKGDYTLDFNTSYSGLFIDELAPLGEIQGLEDCDATVWKIMAYARERGIRDFVRDATAEVMKYNRLRSQPFYGIVGRRRFTDDRSITSTYAGVHWFCKAIKSGSVRINKIATMFNFTGNLTLSVYNNFNELITTRTLSCTADTFVENTLAVPIDLDLYSPYCDNIEYFFVYTLGANQPKNNDLSCNCGNTKFQFSPNRPYYTRTRSDAFGWANYIMVGGFETDDLEFMEATHGGSNYMNGLLFDVEIRCNFHELFCMNELDYVADPIAASIAHAILYKSAILLAEYIFAVPKINYFTLINRENLAAEQANWLTKYTEMIQYIGLAIDTSKNDCFTCYPDDTIQRHNLLIT